MKYLYLSLVLLLSSCGIVVEVQDTDDMYWQKHDRTAVVKRAPRVKVRSYSPSSYYYYPDMMIGHTNMYQTWFMRPMGTIIIREAPNYNYGKRPAREEPRQPSVESSRRRGRQ